MFRPRSFGRDRPDTFGQTRNRKEGGWGAFRPKERLVGRRTEARGYVIYKDPLTTNLQSSYSLRETESGWI